MISPTQLVSLLEQQVSPLGDEYAVQDSIEHVLKSANVGYVREFCFCPGDRVDFMVGSMALEVKTKGSAHSVMRQLARYAAHDQATEVVLFTTRSRLCNMPSELNHKPVLVAYGRFV